MVSLLTAEQTDSLRLSDFDRVLSCQLERGLHRFRSATGEEHRAASKAWSREGQDFLGKLLGDWCDELGAVNEFQLLRLLSHASGNLLVSVSDEVDGGTTGEVEVSMPAGINDEDAFATNCNGIVLVPGTPEQG